MKVIYFCDPHGTSFTTPEDEFDNLKLNLEREGMSEKFISLIKLRTTSFPKPEDFDIMFLDYGGLKAYGCDILYESLVENIIDVLSDNPNKIILVVSTFSVEMIKEFMEILDKEKPFNLFFTMNEFIEYYKTIYNPN